MNSRSGRLSSAEMKERQKQMLTKAEAVQPTVAVMESNWKATIDSQREQVNTLSAILDILPTLATAEQIAPYLTRQLEMLRQDGMQITAAMEQHRNALAQEARKASAMLEDTVKDMKLQAGSMKENFGLQLSEEREQMESYRKKLFWISLIPSLIMLVSEWVPRIWPQIFPG